MGFSKSDASPQLLWSPCSPALCCAAVLHVRRRGKVLGKGSFGQAVLVTHKLTGKHYVIKEIDISRMPKAERDASEQEAKVLMALSHPNIVRCTECFVHQGRLLCIVMDWCSEGTDDEFRPGCAPCL
jgi:serine/threonine protein kinase